MQGYVTVWLPIHGLLIESWHLDIESADESATLAVKRHLETFSADRDQGWSLSLQGNGPSLTGVQQQPGEKSECNS